MRVRRGRRVSSYGRRPKVWAHQETSSSRRVPGCMHACRRASGCSWTPSRKKEGWMRHLIPAPHLQLIDSQIDEFDCIRQHASACWSSRSRLARPGDSRGPGHQSLTCSHSRPAMPGHMSAWCAGLPVRQHHIPRGSSPRPPHPAAPIHCQRDSPMMEWSPVVVLRRVGTSWRRSRWNCAGPDSREATLVAVRSACGAQTRGPSSNATALAGGCWGRQRKSATRWRAIGGESWCLRRAWSSSSSDWARASQGNHRSNRGRCHRSWEKEHRSHHCCCCWCWCLKSRWHCGGAGA